MRKQFLSGQNPYIIPGRLSAKLANRAIVIGVNNYQQPIPSLTAPLSDALNFRDWLKKPDGGNVPEQNIALLLSPGTGDMVPQGLQYKRATQNNILAALAAINIPGLDSGERFFFYYSGHGLNAYVDFAEVHALIPEDCTYIDPTHLNSNILVKTESVYEYMKPFQFQEQFFIIDACRNAVWDRPQTIGAFPLQNKRNRNLGFSQQFVLHSTTPGLQARQNPLGDSSAFTDILLKALAGTGSAKVYDSGTDDYQVSVGSAFEFVRDEMRKKNLIVDRTNNKLVQIPTRAGEANSDPVFLRIPTKDVKQESLNIFVDPAEVALQSSVEIWDGAHIVEKRERLIDGNATFCLLPRRYGIGASAPGFQATIPRTPIALYEPSRVTIKMLEQISVKGFDPNYPGSQLEVLVSDDESLVELLNDRGRRVRISRGGLAENNLQAGAYSARLLSGDAAILDSVDTYLSSDGHERIFLAPRTPPLTNRLGEELVTNGKFRRILADNIEISEQLGPISNLDIADVLSFAGAASVYSKDVWPADRLRSLGLSKFSEVSGGKGSSGLLLLFGVELEDKMTARSYIESIKILLNTRDQLDARERAPSTFSRADGLGYYAEAVEAESFSVRISLSDQSPAEFHMTALPQRLTLLVVHRYTNGETRVFQYMPHFTSTQDWRFESALGSGFKPKLLRRIDYMQRLYMNGKLDLIIFEAAELLEEKWSDPIAECLLAYALIKTGQIDNRLGVASAKLLRLYPQLPDSYVISAQVDPNDPRNAEFYNAALNLGIPTFADGLTMLAEGITQYNLIHEDRALIETLARRQIPGLIWSATP